MNQLKITEPRGRYVESYQLDIQDRVTSTNTYAYNLLNQLTVVTAKEVIGKMGK